MIHNQDISVVERENCTGCGACRAACAKTAIRFAADSEGFPSPIIDREKCVGCGACAKACPVLTPPPLNNIMSSYAVQIKDQNILQNSTSGGFFTAAAASILPVGGGFTDAFGTKTITRFLRKLKVLTGFPQCMAPNMCGAGLVMFINQSKRI